MVKDNEILRIREELERNPKGMTIEDVSQKLSMNRGTAAKYLNLLVVSGQAEMRTLGPAKLFSISQRVPLSQMLSVWTDLILILDADLFIQQVNDALLTYFQLERDQLMGVQLMHSPLAQYFNEIHLDTLKAALDGNEKIFEEEMEIHGKKHTFRIKVLPLVFDQGGKGIGAIFIDITGIKAYQHDLESKVQERTELLNETNVELERRIREYKKIEKALLESEEKYRALVDNITEVIFTINDHGVITYLSPAILPVIGYSPDELLGHPIADYVHSDDLVSFTKGLDKSKTGNNMPFEFRLVTKDGVLRWVHASGKPVGHAGAPDGYQGMITDIQEQKRGEDTLRRANKQIVLLNSITRHDILNGITKLLGYLEIAKRQTKDPNLLELLDKEKEITNTIQRQISFTRDYQNIGIRPPQWKDIGSCIRTAAEDVNLGKITLSVTMDKIAIFADDLVEKVFFNLIENSVQHGEKVTKITFSSKKKGKSLVIICEDDGKGIIKEEKELIFEHSRAGRINYGLFFSREVLAITGLTITETGLAGTGARFEIMVPEEMIRGV
ncbi:MAG: PAS domain S-box protein [Methanoregula sp.]|nr:PAS domain S-box protein [Methanoregula sp.]